MKKILVIEDDQNILDSVIDFLEAEDFKVYTAVNGEEGLTAAKNIMPDLIICDISMPGISGYDVLEELSKHKETALIPFIFLSAKVDKSEIRYGMELGADDYLTKPFKLEDMLKAIKSRLKKIEVLFDAAKAKGTAPAQPQQALKEEDHIFLTIKNKPQFLKISNIVCITAESEYTIVYTVNGEKNLIRKLLKEWEEMLPEKSFLRIHRSTIINLNFVDRIEKGFNYSYIIYLKNIKEPFIISRRYALAIKNRF